MKAMQTAPLMATEIGIGEATFGRHFLECLVLVVNKTTELLLIFHKLALMIDQEQTSSMCKCVNQQVEADAWVARVLQAEVGTQPLLVMNIHLIRTNREGYVWYGKHFVIEYLYLPHNCSV